MDNVPEELIIVFIEEVKKYIFTAKTAVFALDVAKTSTALAWLDSLLNQFCWNDALWNTDKIRNTKYVNENIHFCLRQRWRRPPQNASTCMKRSLRNTDKSRAW